MLDRVLCGRNLPIMRQSGTEEQTDGWMGGGTAGRMGGRTDGCAEWRTVRRRGGHTGARTDTQS